MNKPVKTAVIGYGYWGKNIARVLASCDAFELSAIVDPDGKALQAARRVHPNVAVQRRMEDLPDAIECVALVTPADTHFALARHFLGQGKHVLVTKPMTRTYKEALQLYKIADRKKVTLFADHTFIFHPAVQELKRLLPRIGQPLFVLAQRMNLGLYQSGVNVIYDLMPHDLSILTYLFETPIREAHTTAFAVAGLPQQDLAHASFQLASGIKGLITASWLWPNKVRQFFVVGSEGMLVYDDVQVAEKVKLFNTGITISPSLSINEMAAYTTRISYRQGDLYSPAIQGTEALAIEMEEFGRAIRSKEVRSKYRELNLLVMQNLETVAKATGAGPFKDRSKKIRK